MEEITIRQLVDRSHALSISKGWYDESGVWPDTGKVKQHNVPVAEKLALIHSEISEALEAYRETGVRKRCTYCNGTGSLNDPAEQCPACTGRQFLEVYVILPAEKPEGFVTELADAVIRIADLCGALGLDLAAAIEWKHAYNSTRAYRHGGKKC